jgi:hypothetical protein
MAKKETAEEKLLKIIEATKKAKGIASAEPAASTGKSSRTKIFTAQQINVALAAAALAGFLFFVYQIHSGVSLLGQDLTISVDAAAPQSSDDVQAPRMKSIAYYIDKIAARNLFQPYEKKTSDAQGTVGQMALSARMSKYKLVGLAWLDVPESATIMLENTATHETRFLREGDKIEDVKVKSIFTDRVVFSSANEEITIKL